MSPNWNSVIEDLGPRLFRYFRARFAYEEASDLTQEALIRLVRKFEAGSFAAEKGNLRMYAYGIAHFVALEGSKTKLKVVEAESAHESTVVEDIGQTQQAVQMRNAFKKLEPIQTEILSLMIDEELTLADISKLLDMPVGTIKSHISRAKDRLREILGQKRESL